MLSRILIGLDTPEHARALTEVGISWGRRFGAVLVGLATIDEPGIRAIEPLGSIGGTPDADPVYYMGYENRMAEYRRRAEAMLAEFAARCDEAGVVHEEHAAVGTPHELIERQAGACALIVLPARSHFRFTTHEDAPDDGLIKRILKDTTRPVVVVPEAPPPDGPAVVAYDGSLQADRALAAFVATGLAGSGPVQVVSVAEDSAEASRLAEQARRLLAEHRVAAEVHAMESDAPPAVVVLEQARRLGAGLLVMGAYGRPVLREFFLGSVTRSVLAECPIPLFLSH